MSKGHTRIPHELYGAVVVEDFTLGELKCLLVAIRRILGYLKKRETMTDRISLSQFEKQTGLSNRAIRDGLKGLAERGILTPVLIGGTRFSGRRATVWHLNDSPETWRSVVRHIVPHKGEKTVAENATLQGRKEAPESPSDGPDSGEVAESATLGGKNYRATPVVEWHDLPSQKKSGKKVSKESAPGGAPDLPLLLQEQIRSLGNLNYTLNQTDRKAVQGVRSKFDGRANNDQLVHSFRNFAGTLMEIRPADLISGWVSVVAKYLPAPKRKPDFQPAGQVVSFPRRTRRTGTGR